MYGNEAIVFPTFIGTKENIRGYYIDWREMCAFGTMSCCK